MSDISKDTDGMIIVTQNQPVVLERFTAEQIETEISSIESELSDFDARCASRRTNLEDRLAYLNGIKTNPAVSDAFNEQA